MKGFIKSFFVVLTIGALLAGFAGCTKSDTGDNPPASEILTDIGGLQSRRLALGGEGIMIAAGAQTTDILIMEGSGKSYECAITSVGEKMFKFRVPSEKMTSGATYKFTIRRGEQSQEIGSYQLSFVSFSPDVPDDKKSTLRGMVYCEEKGVPDVLVTDGVNIVKTDANGYYYIESDKRYGNVYIILPSGYDVKTSKAMPQFWAKTDAAGSVSREQHHFELVKNNNDNHTLLIATDIHISNRNLYPLDLTQFNSGFVNDVTEAYKGKSNVYCLNLGDFAWDIYWYQYWGGQALENATAQISGLPFQFWSTMGNHDNDGHAGWATKGNYAYGTDEYWAKDLEASAPFRSIIGPTHIAMNIGKIHYILVDNINYENTFSADSAANAYNDDKMGDRDYHGGFRPDVVEWVKKDLSYVDKSTPVVVGFHIPLGNAAGDVNGEFVTNYAQREEFISLFDDFAEVEFVSGHTHVNRMRPVKGHGSNMYEHNIGAVCGIWWNTSRGSGSGNNQVTGNPSGQLCFCSDGAPSGYMVYDVNGTNRSWHYKAIGFNKTTVADTKQFKTYDMNEVASYFNSNATGFINTISTTGIENTSKTQGSAIIKATKASYGVEEEPNTVWINVWGFEKGDFAGYGTCNLKVIEGGVTTDITTTVNDGNNTANPIEGYRDPISAVTYDVYRYNLTGKFSSASMSRANYNHIFKYIAKSKTSTLTIVYTDRFGKQYRETMTRPKKFADATGTPIYTLD